MFCEAYTQILYGLVFFLILSATLIPRDGAILMVSNP
jgi:hypothetical protein